MKISLKYFRYISLIITLLILVSCIPGSGDEPWSEYFLSVIDSDGTNLHHLAQDVYGNPKFSYDKEKIIIANNDGFWELNSDGSEDINLVSGVTPFNMRYAISKTSNELISSNGSNVFKLNFENHEIQYLTNFTDGIIGRPNYSYDESKIIFSWSNFNNDLIENKLIIINSDGSGMETILCDSTGFDMIYNPTFIPNTDKIVFSKPFQGVFTCNVDGSSLEHIYTDIVSTDPIKTDGEIIVFTANSHEIINYDLINDAFCNLAEGYNPDLSPTLSKVIYHRNGLFIIDTHGDNMSKIASSHSEYQSFSKDGEKIVFLGEIQHNSKKDNNPLK